MPRIPLDRLHKLLNKNLTQLAIDEELDVDDALCTCIAASISIIEHLQILKERISKLEPSHKHSLRSQGNVWSFSPEERSTELDKMRKEKEEQEANRMELEADYNELRAKLEKLEPIREELEKQEQEQEAQAESKPDVVTRVKALFDKLGQDVQDIYFKHYSPSVRTILKPKLQEIWTAASEDAQAVVRKALSDYSELRAKEKTVVSDAMQVDWEVPPYATIQDVSKEPADAITRSTAPSGQLIKRLADEQEVYKCPDGTYQLWQKLADGHYHYVQDVQIMDDSAEEEAHTD